MSRSGRWGMRLHQWLSFRGAMMRLSRAEAVFWPGCALMNLDGAVLERTREMLERAEPGIGLSTCCCGQPSACLFPEEARARREKLRRLLARRGVKRIYAACPNCMQELRALGGAEVFSIWPVLERHLSPEELPRRPGRYIWHDPCPTRGDREQQEAVRALLARSGCDCCQPEHTGEQTRCCGNYRMLHTREPEKSARIRARRLEELPAERGGLSSRVGCLGAFRGEGREGRHLLELLFGESRRRSWGNRIKTTLNAR